MRSLDATLSTNKELSRFHLKLLFLRSFSFVVRMKGMLLFTRFQITDEEIENKLMAIVNLKSNSNTIQVLLLKGSSRKR